MQVSVTFRNMESKEVWREYVQQQISKILIPTERVVELRGGKKKESDKKFYPGYILVEMDLDDETWHLVKSTPRVTGFVGGKRPVAIPEEEVEYYHAAGREGTCPSGEDAIPEGGECENC